MKIAYLILAHADAPHLGRLVRALAGEDIGIFIHIDKKSDEAPFRRECDVYAGSQWWSLTRSCAEYVLDKIDTNCHLRRYFRTAFAPEEIIFHTIIAASPFREHAVLREDGVYPGLAGATITHYIIYDECGQHTFTERDYDMLVASDRMFCRKVVTGASDRLVELIDNKR